MSQKTRNKLRHAAEILWLILGIGSLGTGIYDTMHRDISKSYVFFIMTFICFIMYMLRRYQRIQKSD